MKGTLYFEGDSIEVDVTLPSLTFRDEPIALPVADSITGTATLDPEAASAFAAWAADAPPVRGYISDGAGQPMPLEAIPADVIEALAARGIEVVDGPASVDRGQRIEVKLEPEVYARQPLSDRERELLYGDGHRVNRGLLAPAYQEPTESDSRPRRRWIARKGRR